MDDRFSPSSAHSVEVLAQTLHDPMFEPQSSYNFEEPGEEQQRELHETMGSPQAPNQQSFFNSVNGTSFDPEFSFPESDNQFTQNSGPFGQSFNAGNLWQDHSTPSDSMGSAFPDANAMQQIVQNRRSVKQQFGQITPPDDTISEFTAPKQTSAEAAVAQAAERARHDKSERARNAANQRHAKTKKMRKDSQGSNPVDSEDEEGGTGDKKEKYREKNRLAAAKCRAKKKENIEDIEVKHRKLSAMNSSLKKQVQDLRGELTGLRTHALNHQDCNCQIARYNINRAKRVAMGADAPSPTMGFGGGSLSYLRSPPGMGGMSPQPNSFANSSNFAFASVTTPNDMGGMQSQEGSPHFGDYMPSSFGGQGFSQP
ncbi:hypothetical protein Q7P37_002022 [Cladosporium fusiforme]